MSKYKTVMNAAEKKRLAENRLDARIKREQRENGLQPTNYAKNISPRAHVK